MNPLKQKAISLREAGYSYNMIRERIGVSKSTLNNWLRTIPFTPNRELIQRVGQAKLKSALFKQKAKFESIEKAKSGAKKDIGTISKRDLLMLGIGLYLGEGSKTHENVRIANSDPKIIHLAMRWFSVICGAKMENFKVFLHIYPDSNARAILDFWSKETGIPRRQFGKIVVDTRENKSINKKGKLPYGTFHLRIKSNGSPELGVNLHRKIMAWIENCVTKC